MNLTPKFKHNCDQCIFLETNKDTTYDLYYCNRFNKSCIVMRFGDYRLCDDQIIAKDLPEHIFEGLLDYNIHQWFKEGILLAFEKGLYKDCDNVIRKYKLKAFS